MCTYIVRIRILTDYVCTPNFPRIGPSNLPVCFLFVSHIKKEQTSPPPSPSRRKPITFPIGTRYELTPIIFADWYVCKYMLVLTSVRSGPCYALGSLGELADTEPLFSCSKLRPARSEVGITLSPVSVHGRFQQIKQKTRKLFLIPHENGMHRNYETAAYSQLSILSAQHAQCICTMYVNVTVPHHTNSQGHQNRNEAWGALQKGM